MLTQFIEKSRQNAVERQGDYRNAQGLLICGSCGTPRQVIVPTYGTEPVYCMCRCEAEAYERERAQLRRMQDRNAIARLQSSAFDDSRFSRHRFDEDDGKNPAVSRTARRYVEAFDRIARENCGLMFYGPTGSGKSFYAACIVNALTERRITAFMTSVTALTRYSDAARKEEMLRKIAEYDLVVIDDIGAERSTEYALEQIYLAVDTRYRSARPLIVTTKLHPSALAKTAGAERRRIYERLSECCTPVELRPVQRENSSADKREVLRSILFPELTNN